MIKEENRNEDLYSKKKLFNRLSLELFKNRSINLEIGHTIFEALFKDSCSSICTMTENTVFDTRWGAYA
jgi:hypothetical protein